MYPLLFTDPEGDSCFSIYQIRWIKKRFFNFFFWSWNFCETKQHFSLRSQNSEYPRIFQVTGANQNARKLLSTDLATTYSVALNNIVTAKLCWQIHYKANNSLVKTSSKIRHELISIWKLNLKKWVWTAVLKLCNVFLLRIVEGNAFQT